MRLTKYSSILIVIILLTSISYGKAYKSSDDWPELNLSSNLGDAKGGTRLTFDKSKGVTFVGDELIQKGDMTYLNGDIEIKSEGFDLKLEGANVVIARINDNLVFYIK